MAILREYTCDNHKMIDITRASDPAGQEQTIIVLKGKYFHFAGLAEVSPEFLTEILTATKLLVCENCNNTEKTDSQKREFENIDGIYLTHCSSCNETAMQFYNDTGEDL